MMEMKTKFPIPWNKYPVMCMQNQMTNMMKIQAKITKVMFMMMEMITNIQNKEKKAFPIYYMIYRLTIARSNIRILNINGYQMTGQYHNTKTRISQVDTTETIQYNELIG